MVCFWCKIQEGLTKRKNEQRKLLAEREFQVDTCYRDEGKGERESGPRVDFGKTGLLLMFAREGAFE